ncbi:MAG TPA: alpha/beta hydrolase, partial [Acidimicrobiales bacterium]|nr:alpha/beta hydrolase [Acidimicrobiales bacterium]
MTTTAAPSADRAREPSRAWYPDVESDVRRAGVAVHYEVYGAGEPTILLLPTWSAVTSRVWKMQIPYLARHARVITFDGRGNGRSDRPEGVEAYLVEEFAADALAVLDACGVHRAAVVSESCGVHWALRLAVDHPERVERLVCISPAIGLAADHPGRERYRFDERYETEEGWAKYNRHFWGRSYAEFLEWFFTQCFNEPHSTKPIEDAVGWGLETTPERLTDHTAALALYSVERQRAAADAVRCPTLVIHGTADVVRPHAQGAALAAATGGTLLTLDGSGHLPEVRDPVRVNVALRAFACPPADTPTWRRARNRRRRALFVSSPIGLGHA